MAVPAIEAGIVAAEELGLVEEIEEVYTAGAGARAVHPALGTIVEYYPNWDWIGKKAIQAAVGAISTAVVEKYKGKQAKPSLPPKSPDRPTRLSPMVNSRAIVVVDSKNKPNKPKAAKKPSTMVTVSKPVSQSVKMRVTAPVITHMPSGAVRISHREYVGDASLTSTGTYNLKNAMLIDPAEALTFPWLSTIAPQFEQFRFHSLRMVVISEAPTSAPGAYLMSYDPNGGRQLPSSKVAQAEIENTIRSPAWQSATLAAKVDTSKKYIAPFNYYGPPVGFQVGSPLTNNGPSLTDVRTTSAGILFMASSNTTTGNVEMWLEYDVELMAPTLSLPPSSLMRVLIAQISNATYAFGDVIGLQANTSIFNVFSNLAFSFPTATTFQFQAAGNCLLCINAPTSSASSSNALTITGCTSTLIINTIASGNFCVAYALTNVVANTIIGVAQSGTWNNLTASTTAPLKIYVLPYDATLPGTTDY